jgi:two-component system OmpR family response regulator
LGGWPSFASSSAIREVLARVRAVLRRTGSGATRPAPGPAGGDERLTFEGWVLDVAKRELTSPSGQSCELTTSEFDLLKAFATFPAMTRPWRL